MDRTKLTKHLSRGFKGDFNGIKVTKKFEMRYINDILNYFYKKCKGIKYSKDVRI